MSSEVLQRFVLFDVVEKFIDYRGKTPRKTTQGIPLITAKIVKDGFIFPANEFIALEDYDTWMTRGIPQNGDVLITTEAPLGEIAQIKTSERIALAQRLIALRGKKGILENSYLKYSLMTSEMQGRLRERSSGSTVNGIKSSELKKIEIDLHPYPEQCEISAILTCLDDKIELNNRINKTLEEMAQAIFKSWFVDFEPFQDGEFVDSEMGMIPRSFTVSTIGDFSDVIDCLHSKKPNRCKSGEPFLQLNNICDSGLLDMKDIYYISESDYLQWITRCEATNGDCVITNVGRVGAVSQIPEGIKAALGRNMTCVRCRKVNPYPTFLIECLVSEQMKHEIEMKTDSGTILDALNVKSIPKLRFICPDKSSLDTFEKTVRPIRKHMENIIRENRQISQLRDNLLPKLMSGEIRVPVQED